MDHRENEKKGRNGDRVNGLVIAGLGGGSGKSVIAVGLVAALARRGCQVRPYKKGPDYIDAGWLQLAAGQECCNLDAFLMREEALVDSFLRHAKGMDFAVVEGNRGIFDGFDADGTFSTAELAKTLKLPVVLVVDCTKTTRTVAAMVLGCRELDDRLDIRGVILNKVGSSRHGELVREAVEQYAGIPVLGVVPRQKEDFFPQRHLGITPTPEHASAEITINRLAELAEKYLDIARIESSMAAISLPVEDEQAIGTFSKEKNDEPVRIGVVRDAAFQFYYPENLEALRQCGATLVEVNALKDSELPNLDCLYIGGGFPETSIRELSANGSFLASVKEAADRGLPIYAECGGLIYLGESMEIEGEIYPLAGVFPVRFDLKKKPQAHGYTMLTVDRENPFYAVGTKIKGHEFRYSRVLDWPGDPGQLAMKMERGIGFSEGREGLVKNNALALYSHIHAVGTPEWAPALIAAASHFVGLGKSHPQ